MGPGPLPIAPTTSQMPSVIIRQIMGIQGKGGKEIQVCKTPDMVPVLKKEKESKATYGKKNTFINILSAPFKQQLKKQASHYQAQHSPTGTDRRYHGKSSSRRKLRS